MRRSVLQLSACALFLTGLLGSTPATASEKEAESCLRTQVWASYEDRWALRTMTRTKLTIGGTHSYRLTLYKGTEYRFATCGDSAVGNLDVLLYDANGKIVTRDSSPGRDPSLVFTPDETATYYVVLYLRELTGPSEGNVAMAVTYR